MSQTQQPAPQQQPVPDDLLIKGPELVQLNNFIGKIPTEFGFHIVNFFNSVRNLRNQEAQNALRSTEVKETSPAPTQGVPPSEQGRDVKAD